MPPDPSDDPVRSAIFSLVLALLLLGSIAAAVKVL